MSDHAGNASEENIGRYKILELVELLAQMNNEALDHHIHEQVALDRLYAHQMVKEFNTTEKFEIGEKLKIFSHPNTVSFVFDLSQKVDSTQCEL